LSIFLLQQKTTTNVSAQFEMIKARALVEDIANAAEQVYQEGQGSKTKVFVTVPENVNSITLSGNSVSINLDAGGEPITIYRALAFNVSGIVTTEEGKQWITIENTAENGMQLGAVLDTTMPSITATAPSGYITSTSTSLSATTNEAASCKYHISDVAYANMANSFSGAGTTHTADLAGLSDGVYTYYARCNDSSGNIMTTSSIINFTVDTTKPRISDVFALSIGQTTARISFLTNENANSSVGYGTTTALDTNSFNAPYITAHNFPLSSLNSSTTYYFNVSACDIANNCQQNGTFNFTTLGSSWTTLFFDNFARSDSGNLGSNWTESGGRWEIDDNRAETDDCDSPGDNMTTKNIDLSFATNAKFSFDWEVSGLDDSAECLRVHVSNGTKTVGNLFKKCGSSSSSGTQIINLENNITFTSNMTFTFDCVSDHSSDDMYIDNVNITAYS
ncbi:fibronectin type III domain-containing protein, partial [Candidatus Woesearchaeota archaeon]|nr:fibronectin type III domain-containing protein [Candidatus Woesearchaeota archaeon]